jgi:hypothetical protein
MGLSASTPIRLRFVQDSAIMAGVVIDPAQLQENHFVAPLSGLSTR